MPHQLTDHNFKVSVENYTKAIFKLQKKHDGFVKNSQLAEHLKITRPSVSGMLKKLTKLKLINIQTNKSFSLTKKGIQLATNLTRRHRILETFLSSTLKMDLVEIHEEAELLEHAISDRLVDKIDKFLDFPETDPHGKKIPRNN